MITKFKMLPLLIEACPSFQARWEDFLAEYADGEVEPPLYEALGDYARHLIDLLEHDETSCFVEVFEVVERLCLHGDSYVQGAAIIWSIGKPPKPLSLQEGQDSQERALRSLSGSGVHDLLEGAPGLLEENPTNLY